ncbi:MAG TPA: hypothetical protein VFZ01_12105 [Geminicoccaceae bacterium]
MPVRPKVLIGIVGYSPLIEAFPLGPALMRRLRAASLEGLDVMVENMTWSPIHIVQRFQDGSMAADRLILIGAADVSVAPGRITCHRWRGGSLPAPVLQERVYEAVTGIVSLDNTLLIGEHFGVWPDEVFTVEVDMPPSTFGDIVIADSEGMADRASLLARLGFDPLGAGEQLASLAVRCARDGIGANLDFAPKSASALSAHPCFAHTHIAARP